MPMHSHLLLKLLACFVPLTFLCGCTGFGGAIMGGLLFSGGSYDLPPPRVICSTAETITVGWYPGEDPLENHDKALLLISEHCNGDYIETQRVVQGNWHVIDARCIQTDSAAPPQPPCVYNATEHVGFSEEDL